MNAEIISVGTELLLGNIDNTNTTFLSRRLAELGISVYYQSSVGDNVQRLISLLSAAVDRSQLIVITGGLGPTDDDLTKETVCRALNIKLEQDEEQLHKIEAYFARMGREMTENNKKQAMVPEGAHIFPNDSGTAPGLALTAGDQVIIMLPGPPSEMQPMFDNYVAEYLSKYSDGVIFSRTVKFTGIGESALAEKINHLFDGENPTVAPYAKRGEVHIRVTAKAKNRSKAEELCAPVIDELSNLAGGYIYGYDDDTLESIVVHGLAEKNLTAATAESCTAGLLSKRITDIPSSSAVFPLGITTYSNEMKTEMLGVPAETIEAHGAVSPEVAREMAVRVRERAGTDLGVGITGIAGPGGGTDEKPVGLVYIGLSDGENTWVMKNIFGSGADDRDYVRHMAASTALNLIRLYLLTDGALPGSGSDDMSAELGEMLENFKPAEKKTNFIKSLIPWKGDPKSEIIRKCVFLVSLLVLIGCAAFFANYFFERNASKNIQESTIQLINSDAESGETDDDGILLRYKNIWNENHDTIGYMVIPGVSTDNVVMKGTDNEYYLNHKINGAELAEGELFVDYTNTITPDEQSQNITIYGHNRRDGQMFGQLNRYRTDVRPTGASTYGVEHYKLYNLIKFDTIYEEATYKIFAVMLINTRAEDDGGETPFEYRQQDFAGDGEFMSFIEQVRRRSFINTPVDVLPGDHIINLSTCAYDITDARLVIFGRKLREGESTDIDLSQVSVNQNVLLPQAMYDKYPKRYGTAKPVFNDEAFITSTPYINMDDFTSEPAVVLPPTPVSSETASEVTSSQPVQNSRPTQSSQPTTSSNPAVPVTSSAVQSSTPSSETAPSSSEPPVPDTPSSESETSSSEENTSHETDASDDPGSA